MAATLLRTKLASPLAPVDEGDPPIVEEGEEGTEEEDGLVSRTASPASPMTGLSEAADASVGTPSKAARG